MLIRQDVAHGSCGWVFRLVVFKFRRPARFLQPIRMQEFYISHAGI